MIKLGTVNISQKTIDLMNKALKEGSIGQTKYIEDFEKGLAKFFKVKNVIATANGTLADAVSLAAAKYKDKKQRNEVIIPALTFISQINAVYFNHLKPVFVDVNYDYQINVDKIEEKITKHTLALMPTHLLGKPAEMDKILALAKKYNLFVIEDACEALGSKYKNRLCGTIGDMGCFSFFVSHSITTGEGGAIVTNNNELAEMSRSLRNHGRKSDKPEEKFIFTRIGFSAKMNSLEAIIGLGLLEKLPRYIKKRRQNVKKLNKLIGKELLVEETGEYIVPHSLPLILESKEKRDKLLKLLPQKFNIEARQVFCSIPTQNEAYKFLEEKVGSYPVAEEIGEKGLYVPCHQNLKEAELIKIANTIKKILKG